MCTSTRPPAGKQMRQKPCHMAFLTSSLALSVAFLLKAMMPIVGKTHVQAAGNTSFWANDIHCTTSACATGEEPPLSWAFATYQAMASLSNRQVPSEPSKAGTLPRGNFLRKASDLFVSRKTNLSSTLTSDSLILATDKIFSARKLPG